MLILTISCSIALIMLIWFKTEAILEYGNLIGLGKFLKMEEFYTKRFLEPYPLTYPMFIRSVYCNSFFIRLITCPVCLGIWLSIIAGITSGCITLIPVIAVLSLSVFGLIYYLLK